MSARVNVGEHESEPVRGLPGVPPEGEQILWQGAPSWRRLARDAFHTRKIAVYFGLLVAWRAAAALSAGEPAWEAAVSVGRIAALGAVAVGILAGMAWLHGRATVYTITSQRVVIRFGVALTMAVNVPFRSLRSVALKTHPDGTGNIPLAVSDANRVGYLMMWPHARPWRFGAQCEPMLRAVPDVQAVAETLTRAIGGTARRAPVRSEQPDLVGAGRQPVAQAMS